LLRATDFESAASAIPPLRRVSHYTTENGKKATGFLNPNVRGMFLRCFSPKSLDKVKKHPKMVT
ncbi:MAG: hypothetical protein MJ142_07995, partial [Clostridia bacterium]|nr:hypothetical protein [Clostridia bacterium]